MAIFPTATHPAREAVSALTFPLYPANAQFTGGRMRRKRAFHTKYLAERFIRGQEETHVDIRSGRNTWFDHDPLFIFHQYRYGLQGAHSLAGKRVQGMKRTEDNKQRTTT
ncbi:hypothetical protein AAMO2058_001682000 [Amorphochlora amoebiformis]